MSGLICDTLYKRIQLLFQIVFSVKSLGNKTNGVCLAQVTYNYKQIDGNSTNVYNQSMEGKQLLSTSSLSINIKTTTPSTKEVIASSTAEPLSATKELGWLSSYPMVAW